MARRVAKRLEPRKTRTYYPWDQWADGSTWELTRGVDFAVETEIMRVIVLSYARRHGMRATTNRGRDEDTLFIHLAKTRKRA